MGVGFSLGSGVWALWFVVSSYGFGVYSFGVFGFEFGVSENREPK